jgi:hypothetical protein
MEGFKVVRFGPNEIAKQESGTFQNFIWNKTGKKPVRIAVDGMGYSQQNLELRQDSASTGWAVNYRQYTRARGSESVVVRQDITMSDADQSTVEKIMTVNLKRLEQAREAAQAGIDLARQHFQPS